MALKSFIQWNTSIEGTQNLNIELTIHPIIQVFTKLLTTYILEDMNFFTSHMFHKHYLYKFNTEYSVGN